MFSVGIIGYGKLGSALAEVFLDLKTIKWIVDSDPEKFRNLSISKCDTYHNLNEITTLTDYIFIVVNDSKINDISKKLAQKFGVKLKNTTLIHCSGALGLDVLKKCQPYAKNLATIHPYQTFYYPDKELFKCACSYNSLKYENEIINLIKLLGGKPFFLEESKKILYHLSAVLASNITTLLISSSQNILSSLNIPPEKFLPPIIEKTIYNNIKSIRNNEELPLTGPFARGDLNTIKKHINVLSNYPDLLKEYKFILQYSIEHLKKIGKIDEKQYQEISEFIEKLSV